MAKYSEELVEKIVVFIEEEFYSVSEICKALSISRQSFYNWLDNKPEFRKEIDEAMERRSFTVQSMVHSSLKRRLEGGMMIEEKDTYVPSEHNPDELVFKSKTIRRKEYLPDLRTIRFLVEREDRKQKESFQPENINPEPAEPIDSTFHTIEEQSDETDDIDNEKLQESESCNLIEKPEPTRHKIQARPVAPVSKRQKKKRNITTRHIKKCVNFVKF